jgi:hypothetical protein
MCLVQLIYVSTPKSGVVDSINSSLPEFQVRNRGLGLGGMILSHSCFFLQLIEGHREQVNAIYSRIVTDPRHENVTLIRYNEVRALEFKDWNFAIIDADNQNLNHDCAEFLSHMIPDVSRITSELSSSNAMAILRKAAVVSMISKAPHRRKTDIKEIPTF